MGCGSSIHPSIYSEANKINGIKPKENTVKRIKTEDPNQLRGDYSQLQVSRHTRTMHVKDRQYKIFVAADEMSGKIIEEREMLSLGTRSRGTSRNTSRATSPTQTKKTLQNSEEKRITMPPVTESRATSNISNRRSEVDNKEMDGAVTEDGLKHISKAKSKKKRRKSKAKVQKDDDIEPFEDENEDLVDDFKADSKTEAKHKPKKTSGKLKSKDKKQKKHKKAKLDKVENIHDTDMKAEDDESDDDQKESEIIETQTHDRSSTNGHSDQTGIDAQLNGNPALLHDITNDDLNVPSNNIPGSTNHVHFSDEVKSRSRSSSVSDKDSKRG